MVNKAREHRESEPEKWERELLEAGWTHYKIRGRERKFIWRSPSGEIYRGPYGAWRMMKSLEQWGTGANLQRRKK